MRKAPTEAEMIAAAEAAGLQNVLAQFRGDALAAARAAADACAAFTPPADPALEPWPPMRTRSDA